jgi:hypothetical protein
MLEALLETKMRRKTMKHPRAWLPIVLLCAACNNKPGYPKMGDTKPDDGGTLKDFVVRDLTEDQRISLGIGQDDLLIALGQDGVTQLYKAAGRDIGYDEDAFVPDKYRLLKWVQILQLRGSPTCNYYYDNKVKVYYPKPDCPH